MLELARVSVRYEPDEDRLAFLCLAKDRTTARLWLTRRVALKLETALANAVMPRHEDSDFADLLDHLSQTRAERDAPALPPVTVASDGLEYLVSHIVLKSGAKGVWLNLKGKDGKTAVFKATSEPARIFLGILRRVITNADWGPVASETGGLPKRRLAATDRKMLH